MVMMSAEITTIHGDKVLIEKMCMWCKRGAYTLMPVEAWHQWMQGALLQDVWRESSPEQREVAISGTHPQCWDEMFADECADSDPCDDCADDMLGRGYAE